MIRYLLIAAFSLGINCGFSQVYKEFSNAKITRSTDENWNFPQIEAFDGTFQFYVLDKKDFLFTSETFDLINKSREKDQSIILDLNPYLQVFIPSQEQISSPAFIPFEESYKLIR